MKTHVRGRLSRNTLGRKINFGKTNPFVVRRFPRRLCYENRFPRENRPKAYDAVVFSYSENIEPSRCEPKRGFFHARSRRAGRLKKEKMGVKKNLTGPRRQKPTTSRPPVSLDLTFLLFVYMYRYSFKIIIVIFSFVFISRLERTKRRDTYLRRLPSRRRFRRRGITPNKRRPWGGGGQPP